MPRKRSKTTRNIRWLVNSLVEEVVVAGLVIAEEAIETGVRRRTGLGDVANVPLPKGVGAMTYFKVSMRSI